MFLITGRSRTARNSSKAFAEEIKNEQDTDLKQIYQQKEADFKQRITRAEKARDFVVQYYAGTITSTFDTYSLANVKEQVERTKSMMNEKNLLMDKRRI